MLVMLGFMLNSTTNCIPNKPTHSHGEIKEPGSSADNQKPVLKKIITSTQIDQINKNLETMSASIGDYNQKWLVDYCLQESQSILNGLQESK